MSTALPTATDPTVRALSSAGRNDRCLMPSTSPIDAGVSRRGGLSVAEYEQIGRAGILTEDDSVELLEGIDR